MARINFSELDKVIKDPTAETRQAGGSSICLSQFLSIISNIAEKGQTFTESDLALLTKALQQYLNRRTFTTCREIIQVGDIFNVDFGINYEPEMSFNHPGLILELIGDLVLVVPTSTSPTKLANAYHPTNNPTGLWYYYKVSRAEGFAEDCVLILGNVCTISKGRLLEKKGQLTCNVSDENSLYRQLRKIIFSNVFEYEYHNLTDKIKKLEQENNTYGDQEKNNC